VGGASTTTHEQPRLLLPGLSGHLYRASVLTAGWSAPERGSWQSRPAQGNTAVLVVYAGDLVEALSAAEPADKAALYANLGLSLTWHPDRRVCAVRVEPGSACSKVRVGGGT
jgi:hypothetical protein